MLERRGWMGDQAMQKEGNLVLAGIERGDWGERRTV